MGNLTRIGQFFPFSIVREILRRTNWFRKIFYCHHRLFCGVSQAPSTFAIRYLCRSFIKMSGFNNRNRNAEFGSSGTGKSDETNLIKQAVGNQLLWEFSLLRDLT